MGKLLIICGPTATGKTALGVKIAKKFGGEILSADSRQVYRGMDVGTGKDLSENAKLKIKNEKLKLRIQDEQILEPYRLGGIPVWLLDIVDPDQKFSVAHYVSFARAIVEDIWRRRKSRPNVEDPRSGPEPGSGLPIIVGGTGFYIKGLIEGIGTTGIEPDWGLRKKFRNLEIEKLREKLRRLDSNRLERMNESDRRNPRRLIRAIELALKTQSSKPKAQNYILKLKTSKALWIGLKAPNEVLYRRIDERVDKRVKQGIEKEIKQLLKKGYHWGNSALGITLGYKEWQAFFKERKGDEGLLRNIREEVIQRWKFNEHGYARRQMTWFKKQKGIRWFDITKQGWQNKVEKFVKKWYLKK